MATAAAMHVFLFFIIMATLSGINSVITVRVVEVPSDMLDTVTDLSNATLRSQMRIEDMLGQVANALNQITSLLLVQNNHLQNATASMAQMVGQLTHKVG